MSEAGLHNAPPEIEAPLETEAEGASYLAAGNSLRSWLLTTDHKRIAILYLLTITGFFFIAAWAVLALWHLRARPISTVVVHGALLGVGLLTWCATTWALVDDPLFLINQWRWPAQSYEIYGHGGPFDYLVRNVWFLGSALFPLFVVGCVTARDRKFALVWLVWGLVIGVHSILWWRGWFASAGLVRILAVSSPSAALLCLQGFNWSAERLDRWRVPPVPSLALMPLGRARCARAGPTACSLTGCCRSGNLPLRGWVTKRQAKTLG